MLTSVLCVLPYFRLPHISETTKKGGWDRSAKSEAGLYGLCYCRLFPWLIYYTSVHLWARTRTRIRTSDNHYPTALSTYGTFSRETLVLLSSSEVTAEDLLIVGRLSNKPFEPGVVDSKFQTGRLDLIASINKDGSIGFRKHYRIV